MHSDDRFSGHMDPLDPRTLMFGCGACTWPTIPPFRYMMVSDDAIGVFSFLNTEGILLEHMGLKPGLHHIMWRGPLNDVPVVVAILWKTYDVSAPSFRLRVSVSLVGFGVIGWDLWYDIAPCNVPLLLGNTSIIGFPSYGETGATCRLLQVDWDQDLPPNWP